MSEKTSTKRAMTREQVYDFIKDAVAESNQSLAEQMDELRRKADENTSSIQRFRDLATTPRENTPAEKGIEAARFVRCIAAARRSGKTAVDFANTWYGGDNSVTKALEASSATGGGFLISGTLSSDLIELLRANVVVERAGPRRVNLDRGTVTLPRLDTGSTAGWVGEGGNLTNTSPTFGQVTLTARKLGATVAISNDLLRYADQDADRIVRDDLVEGMAVTMDSAFLRGTGSQASPKGLSQLESINTFAANGSVSLANVTNDLVRAIQELMDDNVNISNMYWFFAPRSWKYLFSVRDSNGNQVFRDEMSTGRLYGFPFFTTTNIPTNLDSGGNESEVYLVNASHIVVGQASAIEVDASDTAAYHDGSNVQSAYSLDQTVVRAITRVDINARHDEAICLIHSVTWGA